MAGWRSAEELIGWGSCASSASAWARIIEPIGTPGSLRALEETVRPFDRSPSYRGRMAETQREPVPRVDSGELHTTIGSVDVPIGGPAFSLDEAYTAKITVPAGALSEENPGDPTQSGTYKIVVTAFLDSALGAAGYDMMGYAEGPIIKVESPL